MNKLMRKAPIIAAAVFLLVQISGLAAYANKAGGMDSTRSMLFALALEAGIFVAAYFTRYKQTKKAAVVTLVLFLLVSAALNTAKSWLDLPPKSDWIAQGSAVLFGVVPSLFATVLGALQAYLTGLPPVAGGVQVDTPLTLLYAISMKQLALINTRLSNAPAQNAHDGKKQCGACGAWVDNVGSHVRWEHPKRKVTK